MAAETAIEWADATMNFWLGCTKVGPPCDNCYAEEWAARYGRAVWGPHADRQRTAPGNWLQPAKWNAAVKDPSRPRLVFTNSLADFWDKQAPQEWRDEAIGVMQATPNLHWLILTKRAQNILRMAKRLGLPSNVSLGLSAGSQPEIDRDLPHLVEAARELGVKTTFLSYEPALGPLDILTQLLRGDLSWVIGGGESGKGSRMTEPAWFRAMRDQCKIAGVPFLFKQWGEWGPAPLLREADGTTRERNFREAALFAGGRLFVPLSSGETMIRYGKKAAGRRLDGQEHLEFPAIYNRARAA